MRPLVAVPALVRQVLLRLGVAVLWPLAWLAALATTRAPRWWRRYASYVTRTGARTRAYAWLLTETPPRRSRQALHVPAPQPLTRRALLGRVALLPSTLILRYLAGYFAALLALAAWLCRITARRHPRRLARAQWAIQAYVTDVDVWLLMLGARYARLPEPDPRLRTGAEPGRDHAPLPPFKRRIGWIAIAVDITGIIVVSGLFVDSTTAVEEVIWLVFVADLAIQLLAPYLGIYLASQSGPLTVAQFGLHAIRPLRSLAWALALIAMFATVLFAFVVLVAPFAAEVNQVGSRGNSRLSDLDGGGIVPDGASTAWTIAFVAIGTVVAPILEEFFYRGFMFQALRDGHGTWNAAVISSIAFAAAHFEFAPLALLNRALIGIGLCWLFAKTGRLLPGMFAHAINNAVVIPLVIGWDWQIAIVLPSSLLVIALLATVVSRRRGEWAIA